MGLEYKVNDIETTHKLYDTYYDMWQKNADAVAGEEAIKQKTTTYLPMTRGQERQIPAVTNLNQVGEFPASYIRYLMRAYYPNVVGRSVDGYLGLIFRKDPSYPDFPDNYIDLKLNIDLSGTPANTQMKLATNEVIIKNRLGLFIDFPVATNELGEIETYSIAESKEMNLRPFTVLYNAESILDWREERVNNQLKTVYVKLRELSEKVDPGNEFLMVPVERIRILDMFEGYYRQRLFEKKKNSNGENTYELIQEFSPIINKEQLEYIPFFPITKNGLSWTIDPPVINGLTDVNLALYRNTADYEHALHVTGQATLCVSNIDPDSIINGEVPIGSDVVLQFHENGEAWFAALDEKGIIELRTAIIEKKKDLAVLGARIVQNDRKVAESEETAVIHRAGEQSVLADIAKAVSLAYTLAFRIMLTWLGEESEMVSRVSVNLNTDYLPIEMTGDELSKFFAVWQAGGIPTPDYYYNLAKGELVRPGITYEQWVSDLEVDVGNPLKNSEVANQALSSLPG